MIYQLVRELAIGSATHFFLGTLLATNCALSNRLLTRGHQDNKVAANMDGAGGRPKRKRNKPVKFDPQVSL